MSNSIEEIKKQTSELVDNHKQWKERWKNKSEWWKNNGKCWGKWKKEGGKCPWSNEKKEEENDFGNIDWSKVD